MKLYKPVSISIMALLALLSFNAQAQPIFFERLNFSLVAAQQGLDNSQTSSNVSVSTIKFFRVTNKDILKLLATALNTNWPVGAQLARNFYTGDIFVFDKSGRNLPFNVSAGIDIGGTNVVYFNAAFSGSIFTGKTEDITPNEIQTQARLGKIYFHLFDEQNGITNTDIYFDGLDMTESKQKFTVNIWPNPPSVKIINWKDAALVAGDGPFNDGTWTVVKGNVTGSAIR